MAKEAEKPGFVQKNISLHTSVKAQLDQLAAECGVPVSTFVSDLIKNYGSAQRKKYLPET